MLSYHDIGEITLYTVLHQLTISRMNGTETKMKRTNIEICKSVFEALFQNNPIHKSDLRELTGLGPRSINKWIDLISFIQSQPRLKITEIGREQVLELEKHPQDVTIYSETVEALKAMKTLIDLPPDELTNRLEQLSKSL